MATPWRFESSPGHQQLFRLSCNSSRRSSRNPVRSKSYGVFCCLQIPCDPLTSTIFAYTFAYTRSRDVRPCPNASNRTPKWYFVRQSARAPLFARGWESLGLAHLAGRGQNLTAPLSTAEYGQGELPQPRSLPRYHTRRCATVGHCRTQSCTRRHRSGRASPGRSHRPQTRGRRRLSSRSSKLARLQTYGMGRRNVPQGGVCRSRIPDSRAPQQAHLHACHARGQARTRSDRLPRT